MYVAIAQFEEVDVPHEVVTHLLGTTCYLCLRSGQAKGGGAGGIRTLDRALQPYNGLANRRLQPLGHSSVKADMPDTGACRKRQIPGCRILSHLPPPGLLIEALKRILEAEAGTSGHRCVTRV